MFGDGVVAQFGEESVDGEDEAVERGMVCDRLDLCRYGFVGKADVGVAIVFGIKNTDVNLLNEIRPSSRNSVGVAVVCSMVDEQTKIEVLCLVGVIVEKLRG